MFTNLKVCLFVLVASFMHIATTSAQGKAQFFGNQMPATDAYLVPGQMIFSETGKYFLTYQTDGNLVMYHTATQKPVWATMTNNKPAYRTVMQADGNFAVYSAPGKAVWATMTNGKPAKFVRIQDDGNIVVMNGTTVLWAAFDGNTLPKN